MNAPANPLFQYRLRHLLLAMAFTSGILAIGIQFGWIAAAMLASAVVSLASIWFRRARLIALGSWLALLCLLCFAPVGLVSRPRSPRMTCQSNLLNLGVALHTYHGTYGSFPRAYITGKNGLPAHSWRVAVLPYLDGQAVYDAYDFDESWNGPRNRLLANTHFDILCCPAEGQFIHASTNYFAVVGPGTAWPGAEGSKLSDFKDGPENTILLVEVVGAGIGWAEPRDLHVTQMSFLINQNHGQGLCSNHLHGVNVLFADGHVEFLPETITPEELRALLTINGGEKIGSQ